MGLGSENFSEGQCELFRRTTNTKKFINDNVAIFNSSIVELIMCLVIFDTPEVKFVSEYATRNLIEMVASQKKFASNVLCVTVCTSYARYKINSSCLMCLGNEIVLTIHASTK